MVQMTPRAPSQGPPSLSGWAAHIVVAEHDGFGGPCGHQPVDQGTALVGLLGIDDLVQHVVRDAVPQLQERSPLREGERESRGWAGLAGEGWEVGPRALQQGLQPPRGGAGARLPSPPCPPARTYRIQVPQLALDLLLVLDDGLEVLQAAPDLRDTGCSAGGGGGSGRLDGAPPCFLSAASGGGKGGE